jgi:hypothetical protein
MVAMTRPPARFGPSIGGRAASCGTPVAAFTGFNTRTSSESIIVSFAGLRFSRHTGLV